MTCKHCKPFPVVIRARDTAHALNLIEQGRQVYVCTQHITAMFKISKAEALRELTRAKDHRRLPSVEHHLGGSTFIR